MTPAFSVALYLELNIAFAFQDDNVLLERPAVGPHIIFHLRMIQVKDELSRHFQVNHVSCSPCRDYWSVEVEEWRDRLYGKISRRRRSPVAPIVRVHLNKPRREGA